MIYNASSALLSLGMKPPPNPSKRDDNQSLWLDGLFEKWATKLPLSEKERVTSFMAELLLDLVHPDADAETSDNNNLNDSNNSSTTS